MSVAETAGATGPGSATRARGATLAEVPRTGSGRRARPVGSFLRLLGSEFALIAGRRRNQVGLLILAAVPLILAVSVWYTAPTGTRGPAFFTHITSNGMFVALTALTVQMPLFLPLAVAALSGDAIAGEAGGGTLRYVLTVPVGRTKLLLTKYLAALLGLLLGVAVIAVVGVVVGALLFGVGPVPTLSGTELGYAEGLGRVALAAGYATAALAAVLALGLLISTLTEQPIAAMIAVVVVTMTMQILTGLSQLAWLHPYLLVSHWTAFADLFRDPVFTDAMQRGLLVFACYVLGGLALAIWNFRRKDLTC